MAEMDLNNETTLSGPLITLTYEGEPKPEDMLIDGAFRFSDKLYDFRHVYSISANVGGETIVYSENDFFREDVGVMCSIGVDGYGGVGAITVFTDIYMGGMLMLPAGTYFSCNLDMQAWVTKVEGAMEIDGDVLVFDGNLEGKESNGWAVKVSDEICDLNSITEVVAIVDGSAVVYNQFNIIDDPIVDYIGLIAKSDGRALVCVYPTDKGMTAGTYFIRVVDSQNDFYTARAMFKKKSSGEAEVREGYKFLLHYIFPPIIARQLFSNGQNVPEPVPESVLVSADGYVLTDKNGVYLIPKDGGDNTTRIQFHEVR